MTKVNLSGIYLKSGSKIILSKACSLIIKERKKPQLSKTKDYLVLEEEGKQSYCSSLYPTQNNSIYNADYSGIKYTVSFKPNDKVLIKQREGTK